MKYPEKKKCIHCGDMAVLIIQKKMKWEKKPAKYYYHYSRDYSQGCHQRLSLNDKESLTTWTKEDDINNLTNLLRNERTKVEIITTRLKKIYESKSKRKNLKAEILHLIGYPDPIYYLNKSKMKRVIK